MAQNQSQIDVAVIGAGPAGLIAAETSARAGRRVVVFEAMPTAGRKFLMAGRSGLNISHCEDFRAFVGRYGAAAAWMAPLLEKFSPSDMRAFCAGLGVETFVGTSGRVFPAAMKASPLLRAWLTRLSELGVEVRTRSRLVGLADDQSLNGNESAPLPPEGRGGGGGRAISQDCSTPHPQAKSACRIRRPPPQGGRGWRLEIQTVGSDRKMVRATTVVLALGGASWPRLGSTGAWTDLVRAHGVAIAPFRPSNCGVEIAWSDMFRQKFEGQAIKSARFSFGGASARGEAVVTKRGLEGGPVYALSSAIGEGLRAAGDAQLLVDLKPDLTVEALAQKLTRRRPGDSLSNFLRKAAGLHPVSVALLREAASPPDDSTLAAQIKSLVLPVRAVAGLDRAISTAGGLALDEIDEHLMLRKMPGVFVSGEMLDWDAPTGGYLLQACFATGKAAGEGAARWRADA